MASKRKLERHLRQLQLDVQALISGAAADRRETMNHLSRLYAKCDWLKAGQQINKPSKDPSKGHT